MAKVTNNTSHPPLTTGPSYRWTILALVTEGQSLAALVGLCVLPLTPFFQAEFGLSRAQVGLLISALYVGAVLSSMPSGWLTDTLGSRAMLALSQVVIGAGILLVSRAGSFAQALMAMPLVGLGYGGINPMSSKAVMLWFPGRILGTAMGIKQTGFPVGGALGAATLPGLALAIGWRPALVLATGLILASALLGGWLYRDPPTPPGPRRAAPGLWATYGELFRNRELMLLVVATGVLFAATQATVSGYLVLFLAEVVQMPVVAAGAMLSVAQLGGIVGRIAWGAASDSLTAGRRRPILVAISLTTTLAMGLASLLAADTPLWAVAGCAALLGLTAIAWNGVFATLVSELAGKGSVAGASGLATTANFLGVVLCPPLFGLTVDLSDSYALAWRLMALASLLNVGGLLLVRERPGR